MEPSSWAFQFIVSCCLVCTCFSSLSIKFDRPLSVVERHKRDAPLSYKSAWIKPCSIDFSYNSSKPSGTSFELTATDMVDDKVVEKAARLIQLMMRFIERGTLPILSGISYGIFSSQQLLTDAFPEYAVTEECKFSCNGSCESLCYNGLPRANSSSLPGLKVIVIDSNIACQEDDPEQGTLNLLIKTFAEALFTILLPPQQLEVFRVNYENVKSVWGFNNESVTTYLTEGVVTWLNARTSAGVMNICGTGGQLCVTEWEKRQNMKTKDPVLYQILNDLFNDGREYLISRISTCEW